MKLSLLNLLLLVAIVALAVALFSVSNSYRVELDQLKIDHATEKKKFETWKYDSKRFLYSQTLLWQRLIELPPLEDYGRISHYQYPVKQHIDKYGKLIRLDPHKNYALHWSRRWGVEDRPTRLDEQTVVIEAREAKEFVSQLLELQITTIPNTKEPAESWAFAGFISVQATLNVTDLSMNGTDGIKRHILLGEPFRDYKMHRTQNYVKFGDFLDLEPTISTTRATTLIWLTGWSNETTDLQSLHVTIEELSPERFMELSGAKRFHEIMP